jgi:hypothetical protein
MRLLEKRLLAAALIVEAAVIALFVWKMLTR